MPTVHRYGHLYANVPKNVVEYLFYKYQKLEGSQISKDRRLERFLHILSSAIKKPRETVVGEHKFSKVIFAEDIRIPVGFRVGAKGKTTSVCRDYRLGVTSSGELIGEGVDTNEMGNVLTVSFEMIDKDFYYLPSAESFVSGKFWHRFFMEKVLKVVDGLNNEQIKLLAMSDRYAGDNPQRMLQEDWIYKLKEKISIYCHRDVANLPMILEMRIGEILNVEFNPHEMYKMGRLLLVQHNATTDVAIDRFVEWSLFKGTPIEDILNYTVVELLEEFVTHVNVKANRLRDEVLARYGFEKFGNRSIVERNMMYIDLKANDLYKPEVSWSKRYNGNKIVIDENANVYINGNRICIIGLSDNSHLPVGDKIVQRVFALGTNLRDDIYTLTEYKDMLQNMFEGGEQYEESQSPSCH